MLIRYPMPTQLRASEIVPWLLWRLPYAISIRPDCAYQVAADWGLTVFGTPISGTILSIDMGEQLHEMYDESNHWTWYNDRFYFKRERDAVVFKLKWG